MAYAASKNSLDLLLIGRTGDGKSSTANSILGRETFHASADAHSTTKISQYDKAYFEGFVLKVVDCPGLGDTSLGIRDDAQQFINAITTAIANNPDGYHAILYVVKFGNRFTNVEELNLLTLKGLLGDNFIKDHCIVVMSYGDCFEMEPEVKKDKLTFDQWVSRQTNKHFKKLVQECNHRVVLFDNRTEDARKKKNQLRELIEITSDLAEKGNRYTNNDFVKAETKRKEIMLNLSRDQEKQEVIDEIGILMSKIQNVNDNEDGVEKLPDIGQEIDELEMIVKKALIKNKKLDNTIPLFLYLRDALQAKKKQVMNIIAYDDALKEKRAELEEKMDQFKKRHTLETSDKYDKSLSKTQLKEKEEASRKRIKVKEEELKDRENDIKKLESKFQKVRETDMSNTEEKMKQLEAKYYLVKADVSETLMRPLLDFIRGLFQIRKIIDRISELLKK